MVVGSKWREKKKEITCDPECLGAESRPTPNRFERSITKFYSNVYYKFFST